MLKKARRVAGIFLAMNGDLSFFNIKIDRGRRDVLPPPAPPSPARGKMTAYQHTT